MGNVVVTMFITLDGVMEAPHEWSFPYWNDEIATYKWDELLATDAHLLGRITYEGFAAAWPDRTDEQGFAARMNSLPKYVVSSTLEKAGWHNSTIIRENVADEIAGLKERFDGDILVAGSAALVRTLIQNDLVDEYRLLTYPIVHGRGKRLFQEDTETNLELVEVKSMGSGVALLRYQPARNE